MTRYTILGAGLAGISCSYHLGHKNCEIFEEKSYVGGHVYSHLREGYIWDEGPHVSFTKNYYVEKLFEKSVLGKFLEFPVEVSNYYHGHWIPHPAQSNLFAVPKIVREKCLQDFIKSRGDNSSNIAPNNYGEWLIKAFGKFFSETFSLPYTKKYWTVDPEFLALNWIGKRVHYPDFESVIKGAMQAPVQSAHYINKVRYPEKGGYLRFANELLIGASVKLNHKVISLDFGAKKIHFANGQQRVYEKLICTIPLPELIKLSHAPKEIKNAAVKLACTSLLLINVTANHKAKKPFHWMYVYDEDKLSTRVTCIELLSPNNTPLDKTGIQVEVYESKFKKFTKSHSEIVGTVCGELIEMGLIESVETAHSQYIPYANIIFDHEREANQNLILNWLSQFGLEREADDLEPMTDWAQKKNELMGDIILAGRFGQWKYFWSDDCVLRGNYISESKFG